MSKKAEFIVMRCPKCGKWTYAKLTQKTRLCSRCEKRFKINPARVIYATSHQHANMLVKLKNEEEMKEYLRKKRKNSDYRNRTK